MMRALCGWRSASACTTIALCRRLTCARWAGTPAGSGRVVFAHYHKTGTIVTGKVMQALFGPAFYWAINASALTRMFVGLPWSRVLPICSFVTCKWGFPWEADLPPSEGQLGVGLSAPSRSWQMHPEDLVIHWYRDPLAIILSGFRYHGGEHSMDGVDVLEDWGWLVQPSMCLTCDDEAHASTFGVCGYRCRYHELLQHVDEETGVLMEALLSRRAVEDMLVNLARWANEPRVLHLSMEHLLTGLNETSACLLRFLGRDEPLAERLRQLDERVDTGGPQHHTSSHYDNTRLRAFLMESPLWREHFEKAKRVSCDVFARQSRMYGCPMIPECA